MKLIGLCLGLLSILSARPGSQEKLDHSLGSIFIQANVLFANFNDRSRFQRELDFAYLEERNTLDESNTAQDRAFIQKTNFQTVNLSFPFGAGFMVRQGMNYFGSGFLYLQNSENAILVNRDNNTEFKYLIEAWPAYLEYKRLIPTNILTLSDGDFLYISLRYYWLLRQSKIHFNGKTINSSFTKYGNGFEIALGYQFAEWQSFRVTGELGYSKISLISDAKWSSLFSYPDSTNNNKADWDIGGIQSTLKIHWHFGGQSPKVQTSVTDEKAISKPLLNDSITPLDKNNTKTPSKPIPKILPSEKSTPRSVSEPKSESRTK